VHADGEIWASTLWDLRASMLAAHGTVAGLLRARSLVTGAMLTSPAFPDFLDMRDAMLAANTALGFGQADCARIWAVFAARGMGADASSGGAGDTQPSEGFSNPAAAACVPAPPPRHPRLHHRRGRRRPVSPERSPASGCREGGSSGTSSGPLPD
jgi:Fungalysin metallopeptidase (M36)